MESNKRKDGSSGFVVEQKGREFRWSVAKRNKSVINICSTMLMFGLIAFFSSQVMALPTGGTITQGTGAIEQIGSATNITQDSQRLDINWASFSTGVNESVNFLQPNAEAIAINRVIGGVPSELRGALNANGRVFILNDAGITFFGTSSVNVGALLASTAMDVAMDGDKIILKSHGEGAVVNEGNINVSTGGFAVLAAPSVMNSGLIKADLGQVQLASANNLTVDFRGDNLITYGVSEESLSQLGVINTGTIQAQSGQVLITAKLASDIENSVVSLGGVVDGDAIDADHDGGTVLVSSIGDIIFDHADIHVNGGIYGDAGSVVTKADGLNNFTADSRIEAKGGTEAGNGGLIEVSGHDVLFQGHIDASAPHGKGGWFVLDPATMTIRNGAGVTSSNEIFETTIETLSQGGTNVLIQADSLVTMQNLVDNTLLGGSGNITLKTLLANGKVEFQDLNDKIQTTTGNIELDAGSQGVVVGSLQTGGATADNPGNITVTTTNGGNVSLQNVTITNNPTASVSSADGVLTITSDGNATVNGPINITLTLKAFSGSVVRSDVDIKAKGDITLGGATTLSATSTPTFVPFNSSSPRAFTTLKLHAGDAGGSGDITINGPVSLDSIAHLVNTFNSSASALASANYVADKGGVAVNNTTHILSSVEVDNSPQTAGYRTNANAVYSVTTTGTGELSDITVGGATDVTAKAIGFETSFHTVDVNVDFNAADDIVINNAFSTIALATSDAANPAFRTALLQANNDVLFHAGIENDGTILIASGLTVKSSALNESGVPDGEQTPYNRADANLKIIADKAITMNTVDVEANAKTTMRMHDMHAIAHFDVLGSDDISVTGPVLVSADLNAAGVNSTIGYANATAEATYNTKGSIDLGGANTVEAAIISEPEFTTTHTSMASFTAYAGQGVPGDEHVTIGGNLLVNSSINSMMDGASGSSSAAFGVLSKADIKASGNITQTGNVSITSDFDVHAPSFPSAMTFYNGIFHDPASVALLSMQAGTDGTGGFVGNGTINVNAQENYTGRVDGDQVAMAVGLVSAGDDAIFNNTIDISATTNASGGTRGRSDVEAVWIAAGGVVLDSNALDVLVTAYEAASTAMPFSSASALALTTPAGQGDILLSGNLHVASAANKSAVFGTSSVSSSGYVEVLAAGVLYGTDDVTLNGANAIVTADALGGRCGDCQEGSYAGAALVIGAGDFNSVNSGEDATINGNIASIATTRHFDDRLGRADGFTAVIAEDDLILLINDQDPLAQGNSARVQQQVSGSDSQFDGTAILILRELDGNPDVLPEPEPQIRVAVDPFMFDKRRKVRVTSPVQVFPDTFCVDVNCGRKGLPG